MTSGPSARKQQWRDAVGAWLHSVQPEELYRSGTHVNPVRAALALRALRTRTRVPEQALQALQCSKLSRLVRHAYGQVPYYRQLFDAAHVSPDDIRSLDDLRHIPITRPETFRSLPLHQRLAAGMAPEHLIAHRTSGSTGIPLSVYFTPQEEAFHALLTLRAEMEVGVKLTDHLAMIDRLVLEHHRRWFEKLGILRKSVLNALDDVSSQLAQLRRLRPDGVVSFASQLRLLAQAARAQAIEDLRFRWVFANSSPLFEEARELIAQTFGAQVFSRYDTWETCVIGWECERHEGWHIDCDHVLLECLADNQPAAGPGDVVITNLDLFAMPIIRYALDDVATLEPEPCPCGRTFPRIRTLHGRVSDLLRLPDGRCLDLLVAQLIFKQMEGVAQYRLVQESLRSFRLEIVPAPDFSATALGPVVEQFRHACGSDLSVRVVLLDERVLSSPLKWRFLVSEIQGGSTS